MVKVSVIDGASPELAWTNVAPALREGWEDCFLQSLPPNPLG